MKLLIILLGLFSERFLMHRLAEKRVLWIHWFQKLFLQICRHNKLLNSRVMKTLLMVLPIWLVVAGAYWFLHDDFWGVGDFFFNLVIFYFCIGPMNIFYPTSEEEVGKFHLVIACNAIFAPVFWYLFFGPLFLLLYRLIDLASYHRQEQLYCEEMMHLLDWVPTRITAICYLFVGNFQRGLEQFGHYFFSSPSDNKDMLEACSLAALSEDQKSISELEAENALEYSILLYLVFIAIITIIAWF